jgi:hypothetical protein
VDALHPWVPDGVTDLAAAAAGEKLPRRARHEGEHQLDHGLPSTMELGRKEDDRRQRVKHQLQLKKLWTAAQHLLATKAGQDPRCRTPATLPSLPQPAGRAKAPRQRHSSRRTTHFLVERRRTASPHPAYTDEAREWPEGTLSPRSGCIRSRPPPPSGKKPHYHRQEPPTHLLNLDYYCRTSHPPLPAGIAGGRASVQSAPSRASPVYCSEERD